MTEPLEALERYRHLPTKIDYAIIETALVNYEVYKQDYERVMNEKNSLLEEFRKNQKKLKALEIIKNTDVPLFFIKRHTYKEYLESPFSKYEECFLSEEKYNLVREVML